MMNPEETAAEKAALARQEMDRRAQEQAAERAKEAEALGRKHLRNHFAGMAMQAIISNPAAMIELDKLAADDGNTTREQVAHSAVAFADALIDELEG